MPSTNYQQLADACFRLREKEGFPLCAVDWLHFTNTRDNIQSAILSGEKPPHFLEPCLRIPWLFLCSFYFCFLMVWACWSLRRRLTDLKQHSFDLVAKTWNLSAKTETNDFYYGDLQKRFGSEGRALLLLCGNVSRKNWRSFLQSFSGENFKNGIPDVCLLTFTGVFKMFFLQCLASFQLHCLSRHCADPLTKSVVLWVRSHVLRFQTMMNGLNFFLAARVVQQFRPRAYMTFYEGHAWEECSWRGVQSSGFPCKTVGYQHTVIMSRALDLSDSTQRRCIRPDIILCSGHRTADALRKNHGFRKTKIIPFGTFRRSSITEVCVPNPKCQTVLVLPDFYKEAPFLFNTAIQVATMLKDHHFIFRCHPAYSFSNIKNLVNGNLEKMGNVEISEGKKIEEDFERSSVILYRGSSAVLYAVLNGLKPFYLHVKNTEIIDPIFELDAWRESIDSGQALEQRLREYAAEPLDKIIPAWKVATQYVKGYTMPVGENSITRLLNELD